MFRFKKYKVDGIDVDEATKDRIEANIILQAKLWFEKCNSVQYAILKDTGIDAWNNSLTLEYFDELLEHIGTEREAIYGTISIIEIYKYLHKDLKLKYEILMESKRVVENVLKKHGLIK